LKVVSLAIAFACTTLILIFAAHEFGYDKFHPDYSSIFRILKRNNNDSYTGNRLTNQISRSVIRTTASINRSPIVGVKSLDHVSVIVGAQTIRNTQWHAADPGISEIFAFNIVDGTLDAFRDNERTILLSSSVANDYFGTRLAAGRKIQLFTLSDTLSLSVAAVYQDFPENAHDNFKRIIKFDPTILHDLCFYSDGTAMYTKVPPASADRIERLINMESNTPDTRYFLQAIDKIYFGPRISGENARHGDQYSIIILICITSLLLLLAVVTFINLTTLSLPHRAKELAVKKLAGINQSSLTIAFARESCLTVAISMTLGIMILAAASESTSALLSINYFEVLENGFWMLIPMVIVLFLLIALAPLFLFLHFTRATPSRLLSSDSIKFPRLKRTIMFLQLGFSFLLLVTSLVMKRQINYSLLKEPGRNHDQVVYLRYPPNLTAEQLNNLRSNWKMTNPNIIDVMATSQLPDRVMSKELNSAFYIMSVDRGFHEFFNLRMIEGQWFKANAGDSAFVVNESGKQLLGDRPKNLLGVFTDLSAAFNQPERPLKLNANSRFQYNVLCIRILEVDVRQTVHFLEKYFAVDGKKATISYLSHRFEAWLRYQDRLNSLSSVLAVIAAVLSCLAIYSLSISIVRDKLKQIAVHKLCGADAVHIVRLLVREFTDQMLLAMIVFGPLTYLLLKEILRTFVYTTNITWLDAFIPVVYSSTVIILLCGFQALRLSRDALSEALKG
jgi:putative ABC transport system permease protein